MMLLYAFFATVVVFQQAVANTCPDQTTCPGNQTCCPLSTNNVEQYGCCPYASAVCCKDNKTCCPENNKCIDSLHLCFVKHIASNGLSVTKITKPASLEKCSSSTKRHQKIIEDIPCGPGSCSDDETCCGDVGCCPMPNAVCCSDNLHCCPENTRYDLPTQTCLTSNGFIKNMMSSVKQFKTVKVKDIPCGPGSCTDDETCCGDVGCCPMPNAVCCSDNLHCCPENTRCDLQTQTCLTSNPVIFPSEKKKKATLVDLNIIFGKPMSKKNIKTVICPGGVYYCPDMSTCCQLPNGIWGCCPYPSAMCCNDHVHCCPYGTFCDSSSTTCLRQSQAKTLVRRLL